MSQKTKLKIRRNVWERLARGHVVRKGSDEDRR